MNERPSFTDGEVCAGCGYEPLHIARRIDALHKALQDLARAGEETVTAGHPTGSLLTSLVWAQQALYGETLPPMEVLPPPAPTSERTEKGGRPAGGYREEYPA